MAQPNHTPRPVYTEEALSVVVCLAVDDAYARSQPPRRTTLRIHKAPLGLGGHHACALPAAEGRGSRSARSRGLPRGSSRICSREWWGCILPRCIGG